MQGELTAELSEKHGEIEKEDRLRKIMIHVNERPVEMRGRRQTGLQIKQAAVAQSIPIQLDFILSIEVGPRHTKVIGDTDVAEISDKSRFLAIPDDDNS